MTATLDPFVLEHAPGPIVPLHASIVGARAVVHPALLALAAIGDDRLGAIWNWDGKEADVRYGFYRLLETLETGAAEASRALVEAGSTESRDAVAAATSARWDLHGILASVSDADLDADPGGGEWTVRRTLAHINASQRGYAWGTSWWLSARDQPRAEGPQRAPAELFEAMPEEEREADGSFDDIRRQLDDLVDSTSSRFATLTQADLDVSGGWSGVPVTIAFRQWRWSSHIQEHTVQVEKTLDLLGRRPTEVARLVHLIARAYGRLEAALFARPASELDRASSGVRSAGDVIRGAADEIGRLTPTVVADAEANVPAPDW